MTASSAEQIAPAPLETKARPFLKWAGGKTRLLPELLARLPESFTVYHEPMLGGGAMFFALSERITRAYLSDLSPDLINCFRCVRDQLPALVQDLAQHRYEESYYYELRNADRSEQIRTWSDVQRASRNIYLNKTCYNGLYRVNSRGEFNVPFGRYTNPTILDGENLAACSGALQKAELTCGSFEEVLNNVGQNDFVYFDPPYDPLSQTANFTSYHKEGFDTGSQIALRDVCRELDARGVQFMLSNSYTTLSLELYREFHLELVEAPRAINSQGSRRGKVREIVVRNYI